MDLSGVHQIIQAFMGAREQASRDFNAQRNREEDAKRQAEAFKQQEKMLKMEQEFRRKAVEAENARENYFAVFNQLASGQRKIQGQDVLSGVKPINALPVRNAEGLFEFTQPEAITEFAPDPVQIVNIPGSATPVIIPSSEIPSIEDQVKRLRTMMAPKTEAEKQIKEIEANSRAMLELIRQTGASGRNQATIESRESEGAANRENQLEVARIRGRYANRSRSSPMDRPLSASDAATYGVPIGTTLRDLTGVVLTKPLSANQESRLQSLRNIHDLTNIALELGERVKWTPFKPVVGNVVSWWDNLTGAATPEEDELRRTINELKAIVARERGGTSFTANEQKLLESYIANLTDNPGRAKIKLTGMRRETENKMKEMVGPQSRPEPRQNPATLKGNGVNIQGFRYVLDPQTNEYVRVGGQNAGTAR